MVSLRVFVFFIDVELLCDAEDCVDEPVKRHSARKHKRNPRENDGHGVHHDLSLLVVGSLRCELGLKEHQGAE